MLGIIIQARSNSTRLPRKVLLPFYEKECILEILIDNFSQQFSNIPIIVATTTSQNDDEIVNIALNKGINIYRGDENNVLLRFIEASKKFNLKKIIRVCSDNIFLDMESIKIQINNLQNTAFDYYGYCLHDETPTIITHFGLWTEGVTLEALEKISSATGEKIYNEHVTNYIYTHKDNFALNLEKIPIQFDRMNGEIRLTIDTLEDFILAQKIYSILFAIAFIEKN